MARIRLETIASSVAPPEGQVAIYAKLDRSLYLQDEAGSEFEIFTSGTPGVGGYEVNYFTLTAEQELAKAIELSGNPVYPTKTLLDISNGGGSQVYDVDFIVEGNILTWDSRRLLMLLPVSLMRPKWVFLSLAL